jgi:hypothetical protein
MFFRIWVLYVNKVGLLALGVYLALFPFHGHSWVDRCALVALAIVVTICCTGAILAVPIFIWPGKIRCPLCNRVGEPMHYRSRRFSHVKAAVNCSHCGIVYAKSVPFSFQLCAANADHENQ